MAEDGGRENRAYDFPVLIGDIGGTNARFQVMKAPDRPPGEVRIVKTADFPDIDAAIRSVLAAGRAAQPKSAILAVAGPVEGDEIPLTNSHWVVRPRGMLEGLGLQDIALLNDFEAQALAVASLEPEHLAPIGGGESETGGARVVLGPGTGLGVAGLIRSGGRWIPVPGEGGHIDLGPRTPREFDVFRHLETIEGRISGEQILSGRGLVNLYGAIARADGAAPEPVEPPQVTARALDGSDRTAVETLDIFAACLGRVAGDVALVFKSTGGVYLSGGIAQKIVPLLNRPLFREAFEDKAPHRELMRAMPVSVVTHPLAALIGLAAYAAAPHAFGVETGGRRWTM
ncbi:MAG TPA: glucokinase [Mesorhizobium sp.]|jgi:glucokinase|nr:glucokinase [Mesorhizobium sp.]